MPKFSSEPAPKSFLRLGGARSTGLSTERCGVTGCGEHGSSGLPGGLLEPKWLELEPTLERTDVLQKLKERRNEEEGFTLIELMVVVLIMGILMAIAIPTFLSTRGSANDASAKSNATNAFTNEKSYYASNQAFESAGTISTDTAAAAAGTALDDSLPWGDATTANGQFVTAYAFGTGSPNVLIEASSKSGDCFYILDEESASSSFVGYQATSTACGGAASEPTAAPAAVVGGSSSGIEASLTTTWSSSW